MTTQEIAKRLYELCSTRQFAKAQIELYSEDSVSIEPVNAQWGLTTVRGKEAVIQKGKAFMSLVTEWNGAFTGHPVVYGSFIFMEMIMDLTVTGPGKISIDEMGKFEVQDGKIISEEFCY
jgi:limonene-1,2-epoxide hydrolase